MRISPCPCTCCLGTGLLDQLGGLLVGTGADFDGIGTSLLHLFLGTLLCRLQIDPGLVGRGKTGSDFLAAFIQCGSDRRPDELGDEPPERSEDEALNDDRGVDIHARFSVSTEP